MLASWVEATQTRTIYFCEGKNLDQPENLQKKKKKSALNECLSVSPQPANGFD